MATIDMMQDTSEIVHYDHPEIPLYIRPGRLSSYPGMKALCHWHEDIELIYIRQGEMNYDINGKKILLKEQDVLIVNARHLHYGYSHRMQECDFICILFHPSILSGSEALYRRFVLPVIENSSLEYLHYHAASEAGALTAKLIQQIYSLKQSQPSAYELEVLGCIAALWKQFYADCYPLLHMKNKPMDSDLDLQKKMVSYIHRHYAETIALEDIAASVNISRSKCCIIFKRYLQQSPIDFLNAYRLSVSCHLLQSSQLSITQIATACGFNHLSYFSKIFLRKYGCTPSDYRTQHCPNPIIQAKLHRLPPDAGDNMHKTNS